MDSKKSVSYFHPISNKNELKTNLNKSSICTTTTEIKHFIRVENKRRSFKVGIKENKEEESAALSVRQNTCAAYKFVNTQNCKEKKAEPSKSLENILEETKNEQLVNEKQKTNPLFQSYYWLEPRAIPCGYSTTLYIDLDTNIKRYVEETRMEMRLMPCPFIQSVGNMKHYKSTVVTDIRAPILTPMTQTFKP